MPRNYLSILAETIRTNWDAPALTDFYLTEDGTAQDTSRGNHYTYGEMYAEICRVADLLTALGLQKGDHIAICGQNSAHWVIAYLAIRMFHGVSVTILHSLPAQEIVKLIDFADVKLLLADINIWTRLKKKQLGNSIRVVALDDWEVLYGELLHQVNTKPTPNKEHVFMTEPNPDTIAQICFTSGTNDRPRGVMLPYRSAWANSMFMMHHFPYEKHHHKHILIYFPLSHMLGACLLMALFEGCHVYLLRDGYTIQTLFSAILLSRSFLITMVPAMVKTMLRKENVEMLSKLTSFVEYIMVGGASVSSDLFKECKRRGVPLAMGYGMTETGPLISMITPEMYKIGSCGCLCDYLLCKISPIGEILVKGENVMLGYYKDPEATAAKIDSDGWLHTGDKGYLDEDGYLYVEGRLEQDIIVLPNGENIRPDNIESLINALPEVSESIVLARDGKLVAIVVLKKSFPSLEERAGVRLSILRTVNPSLPLFSQLYDVEITDTPLQRTEKQTLKRYLYK